MAALLLAKRVIEDARGADAASDRGEAERIQAAIGAPHISEFLSFFGIVLYVCLFTFGVLTDLFRPPWINHR